MNVSGVKSKTKKGIVSAKELDERFKVTIDMAQKTIQALLNWQS